MSKPIERIKLSVKNGSGRVTHSGSTAHVSIDTTGVGVGTAGTTIRRAITTEAATANDHITCNLYDGSGVEQTTGSESGIEIYCLIADAGTALNEAIPRLREDEDLFVINSIYDDNGTPAQRWFCISLFTASGDCN